MREFNRENDRKEVALQKKIEEDVNTKPTVKEIKKTSDSLQKALESKGINFAEFASVAEDRRKLLLGEDYQETRTKYGWVYDQPIQQTE